MSDPRRYPLSWPVGWKRTPRDRRKIAAFAKRNEAGYGYRQLTISEGLQRLEQELRRLGVPAEEWLVSTNVPLRIDGLPYSRGAEPEDPGAAVYFRLRAGGKPKVFACDKWRRVADNIAAIAGHVEALRAVERYGVGELEQVFAGYTALPPSAEDWRSVFGFKPDETPAFSTVDAKYRALMKDAHPDIGGDTLQAARLNTARDMARWELEAT